MRLQLALNVKDLGEAVSYYSKLFDATPHKVRDRYANFAIDEPPLKLVLFENPTAEERLHHLGVEVFAPEQVEKALQRFTDAGILDDVQRAVGCCHAAQEKIWSRGPDGWRWEWYRIVRDDIAPEEDALDKTCCTGDQRMENIGAN